MNFGRRIRRLARVKYMLGQLDRATYERIRDTSHDPKMVAKWQDAIQAQIPDFTELWNWLQNNWMQVLSIIISLLVFLEPLLKSENKDES